MTNEDQKRSLTEPEEIFCHQYVEHGMGEDAYEKAFPNKERATFNKLQKLFRNPLLSARIRELQNIYIADIPITKAWLNEQLIQLYNENKAHHTAITFSYSLRALELLAKINGIFETDRDTNKAIIKYITMEMPSNGR